jgi:hypothetical protein
MSPKGSIEKKKGKSPIVPLEKFYQIPFLDRPLPKIISILHYMQLKREEQNDKEGDMYYTPIAEHPFDTLSKKQIEVFGYTFSIESNADALLKISPISTDRHISVPPKNTINHKTLDHKTLDHKTVDSQTLDSQPYSKPIGPLSFLGTTVPQAPDPTFVNFLQACSK